MPSIAPHANGVEFMHGLTLEGPLSSKLSLSVEISKLSQSMSSTSLGPSGLYSTCDQGIKVFNKLIKTKELMANPSQGGCLMWSKPQCAITQFNLRVWSGKRER